MGKEIVREYYDGLGMKEWKRLEKDAYHQLEWLTHIHFIGHHMSKRGQVLDAGGGPGRYSIHLAKKGFRVTLLDISPYQLRIAKRQATRAKVPPTAIKYVEGEVTDMSLFPDNCFDAVLCLTALSHLIERMDREKAVREVIRVARRGAPLFISVINRYAVFRTILQRHGLWSSFLDPDHKDVFDRGIHRAHPMSHIGHFTDAYFFTPEELKAMFEKAGVKVIMMAASEGLASHLQRPFNRLVKDEMLRRKWMDIHWKTCTNQHVLGASEHILLVGRK